MKALLVIDVQNDFLSGGTLAVPKGDEVIEGINQLQTEFSLVIGSQDWHPKNHSSFAETHNQPEFSSLELNGYTQTMWPVHCVQGTTGAQFSPELNTQKWEAIFRKGTNPEIDSYSAFFDNQHQKSTGLSGYLEEKEIDELNLVGLAADYCVYFTAVDAIKEGLKVVLHENLTRAIDSKEWEQKKNKLKKHKRFRLIERE